MWGPLQGPALVVLLFFVPQKQKLLELDFLQINLRKVWFSGDGPIQKKQPSYSPGEACKQGVLPCPLSLSFYNFFLLFLFQKMGSVHICMHTRSWYRPLSTIQRQMVLCNILKNNCPHSVNKTKQVVFSSLDI